MPQDPADDATQIEKKIWEEHVKQYMRWEDTLADNLKSTYALIYGWCTDTLHMKLESRPDYEMIKAGADPIGLLENIKSVMYQFQVEHYGPSLFTRQNSTATHFSKTSIHLASNTMNHSRTTWMSLSMLGACLAGSQD